ncbi:MAG: ATP-dependent sacrificial sulfur transferase LarE [Planctomycetota bacterium]
MTDLGRKLSALEDRLRDLTPLVVAYSGGVDSSLLAAIAQRTLGPRFLAVTGVSPSLSQHQKAQAARVAKSLGFRHRWLTTLELENSDYRANPSNRCYFCKDELFRRLREHPEFGHSNLADGSNACDLKEARAGRKAAEEQGVVSPLAEVGISKEEVRALSRQIGLETADYPASPCLASRLPYGQKVTAADLKLVEQAEDELRALGFRDFRMRKIGDRGRIELAADELGRLDRNRGQDICRQLAESTGLAGLEIDVRPLASGRLHRESRV